MATTEQAFDALFDLVANARTAAGALVFRTAERDIRKWGEVQGSPGSLPALFQEQSKVAFESRQNMPTIVRVRCDLAIMSDSRDQVLTPATNLNALLDAALSAIAPSPADDYRQTLGGLVYDAKPMGEGFYREATTGAGISFVMFPVEILMTL